MTVHDVSAELTGALEALFPPVSDERDRDLGAQLLRLLAEGDPVEVARLADAVGRPEADVVAALARSPFGPEVYRDDNDRVVGFAGLAVTDLAQKPHRLTLDGRELYAWCAADTLYLPLVLGREARVASRCPATGERITLSVSPHGVRELEPPGAVISSLLPADLEQRSSEGLGDVIAGFCRFFHFFASEEAADAWLSQHPGTTRLSIEDGFELARRLAARQWATDPGEESKTLVRRLVDEVINQGRLDVVDELFAPEVAAAARQGFASFRSAFPDWRQEIVELIAEGDKVVGRFRCYGTFEGEFMGIAPNGRRQEVDEVAVLRAQHGRFVDFWALADNLTRLRQLDVIAQPA